MRAPKKQAILLKYSETETLFYVASAGHARVTLTEGITAGLIPRRPEVVGEVALNGFPDLRDKRQFRFLRGSAT